MQQVIIPGETASAEYYRYAQHCPTTLVFAFFRWLDRNEDDGQIVRELLPFSDGQRLYSKYEELGSSC